MYTKFLPLLLILLIGCGPSEIEQAEIICKNHEGLEAFTKTRDQYSLICKDKAKLEWIR